MPKLSLAANAAVALAYREAEALGAGHVDTEHLLLGLLKSEDILAASREALGVPPEEWNGVREGITALVTVLRERQIDPKRSRRALRKILAASRPGKESFSGHRTDRCRAAFGAAESLTKGGELLPEHLLLASLAQGSEAIEGLFGEIGVGRKAFVEDLGKRLGATGERVWVEGAGWRPEAPGPNDLKPLDQGAAGTPYLTKHGRDISELARRGSFDPVIGREQEIRLLAQILVQKRKNNPILVGDPGVGKTCIVEGLAQASVQENASDGIRGLRIIEISMATLLAGTKYRGDFEERLQNIIKEATSDPRIVLFIDEVHTVVGAGGGGSDGLDAGNILKPALARGELRCIGATTTQEYRLHIEKDPALERRFQVVWVNEPSPDEAFLMLSGVKKRFEDYHKVLISDQVIARAIELSVRYLPDARLPDKALDLIDQACARHLVQSLHRKPDQAPERVPITEEDVAQVVSQRCRVPIENLTRDEARRLMGMEAELERRVLGQTDALREVAEAVRTAAVGIRDPRKPRASLMFLGSSGIGKTELAKALAGFLYGDERSLVTFDMSEYQEKHSVARLLGAPPGYVGHEQEGLLASRLRSTPYCVLLFDEIEKAHPDIFDIFLQILDEGRVTDSRGRRVSFSEAIIVFTSNLGSAIHEEPAAGRRGIGVELPAGPGAREPAAAVEPYGAGWRSEYRGRIDAAVRSAMRPELIGRIRKRIYFYPLSRETVSGIVGRMLAELNDQLKPRGVTVTLDPELVGAIVRAGYDPAYGARQLRRAFDARVAEPVARVLLEKGPVPGDVLAGSIDGDEAVFTARPAVDGAGPRSSSGGSGNGG